MVGGVALQLLDNVIRVVGEHAVKAARALCAAGAGGALLTSAVLTSEGAACQR